MDPFCRFWSCMLGLIVLLISLTREQGLDTFCSPGRWGTVCENLCPFNCKPSTGCDKYSGDCNTCKPGWYIGQDFKCSSPCQPNSWGQNCNEVCDPTCVGSPPCHYATGECTSCSAGNVLGPKNLTCVLKQCEAGFWGEQCTQMCDATCDGDPPCDPQTGACTTCLPNWILGPDKKSCSLKENKCMPGYWGTICQTPCPPNCLKGSSCFPDTGLCQRCEPGWSLGEHKICSDPCEDGTFWENCEMNCSSECPMNCNRVTGDCPDKQDESETMKDQEELQPLVPPRVCKPGYYGVNCESPCPMHCRVKCNRYTGSCEETVVGAMSENTDGLARVKDDDDDTSSDIVLDYVVPVWISIVACFVIMITALGIAIHIKNRKNEEVEGHPEDNGEHDKTLADQATKKAQENEIKTVTSRHQMQTDESRSSSEGSEATTKSSYYVESE